MNIALINSFIAHMCTQAKAVPPLARESPMSPAAAHIILHVYWNILCFVAHLQMSR